MAMHKTPDPKPSGLLSFFQDAGQAVVNIAYDVATNRGHTLARTVATMGAVWQASQSIATGMPEIDTTLKAIALLSTCAATYQVNSPSEKANHMKKLAYPNDRKRIRMKQFVQTGLFVALAGAPLATRAVASPETTKKVAISSALLLGAYTLARGLTGSHDEEAQARYAKWSIEQRVAPRRT